MARLIADTNLIIDLERGKAVPLVNDDDEIVISSITASELISGVALASPDRQPKPGGLCRTGAGFARLRRCRSENAGT